MIELTSKSVRTGAVVVQAAVIAVVLLTPPCALAGGPPLPLHSLEGTGGVFATQNAYLVNPAEDGKVFGLPSVGILHVYLGQGKALESFTITETLWNRIELGYAFNYVDFGDLPQDIERMTGVELGDQYAGLHNFNVRVALVRDGEFDMPWLPAVTAGVHYKYNDTVNDIDDDLMGGLDAIGIEDNDGVDFTLYATKMITALPRPVVVSLGLRSTEAAHIGLLGFTRDRKLLGEGNVCCLLTDRLTFAV